MATSAVDEVSAELWAFELKLRDWRRALYQALQCRSFAHRAYVVFPSDREGFIRSKTDTLRALGVGALSYDPKVQRIRVLVPSRKARPTTLHHYYYALGRFYGEHVG